MTLVDSPRSKSFQVRKFLWKKILVTVVNEMNSLSCDQGNVISLRSDFLRVWICFLQHYG